MNEPISDKVCVLYDPRDGRIVHTHRVLTMPGGQEVSDTELEARAKDRANHMKRDLRGLATLSFKGEECDGSSRYRVDLTTKKLTKLDRPESAKTRQNR
jgi:hypothetical protein